MYCIEEGRLVNVAVGCIGQPSEERGGPSLPSTTPYMTSGNATPEKKNGTAPKMPNDPFQSTTPSSPDEVVPDRVVIGENSNRSQQN